MRERGAGRTLGHGRQRRSTRRKMRSCGWALGGAEGRVASAMGEGRRRGARMPERAAGREDEDSGQIFSLLRERMRMMAEYFPFSFLLFLHSNLYIFVLSDLNLVSRYK
jgi:hypothetical protein